MAVSLHVLCDILPELVALDSLQIVEVVCCKLTPLQTELYCHFIQSKNVGLFLLLWLYILYELLKRSSHSAKFAGSD